MRSRLPLLAILLAGLSIAVPHLAHAAIPYWGPIIPSGSNTCALGWNAIIIVANNVISFGLTLIFAFIAPLLIAYAGFLYLTSGANPGNRARANKMLTDALIGLAIALGAWLIVDTVLSVIYDASAQNLNNTPWYSLITTNGSDPCIKQPGSLVNLNIGPGATNGASVTGIDANGNQTLSFSTGQGACSSATIQQVDPGISTLQANQLACIAQQESTCGARNLNYSWNTPIASAGGKASTAAGAFQVLLSSNSSCYDNSICEAAGGTPGVPLNCKSGFDSQGFTIPGSPIVQTCTTAAANLGCSAAAAQCLLGQQSFQTAYKTDPLVGQCTNPGA
jgi:hypothetical protein